MEDNRKFWQRVAKLYTAIQEKGNQQQYQTVIEACLPYLDPESRVLELACGTGQLTRPLCGKVKDWQATDFSPNMVEEARKRGIAGAVFTVEDATALSFADDSFDLVLIANALHIMPRPDLALKEIRRVLRPGGVLLAPTFVYEGGENRLRLWVLDKAGFKTFHQWSGADYSAFVQQADFEILENRLIPGDLLTEAFLAAKPKP